MTTLPGKGQTDILRATAMVHRCTCPGAKASHLADRRLSLDVMSRARRLVFAADFAGSTQGRRQIVADSDRPAGWRVIEGQRHT